MPEVPEPRRRWLSKRRRAGNNSQNGVSEAADTAYSLQLTSIGYMRGLLSFSLSGIIFLVVLWRRY